MDTVDCPEISSKDPREGEYVLVLRRGRMARIVVSFDANDIEDWGRMVVYLTVYKVYYLLDWMELKLSVKCSSILT